VLKMRRLELVVDADHAKAHAVDAHDLPERLPPSPKKRRSSGWLIRSTCSAFVDVGAVDAAALVQGQRIEDDVFLARDGADVVDAVRLDVVVAP
jgi:hypothetical protein